MGNPAPAVAATPHAISVGKLRAVAWAIARARAGTKAESSTRLNRILGVLPASVEMDRGRPWLALTYR